MIERPDPPPVSPKSPWIKRLLIGVPVISAVVLCFLAYIGLFGNFRSISEGKCFRSQQLKPQAITDAVAAHGIKSVLNLRGESKSAEWYKGEVSACQIANIDHTDINIGLGALPKPEILLKLVDKLEAGPYPMLLHCRSGSDRSGLAAAFYLHIVENKPLPEAEAAQVSWRYGHFPIGPAKSIDDFFALYHTTANGQPLKEWLVKTYPAEYAKRTPAQNALRRSD
ncbi:MAG: tyrosine-protein phosphatase [Planctomycetota bacterium]